MPNRAAAAGFVDQLVKARIERHEMRNIVFRGVELHELHDLAQLLELLFGHALRRPISCLPFEQMANGRNILQVLVGQALDDHTAVRVRGDQVFQLQLLERLAHGRAADAKLLRNLHFNQAIACLVASFGNPVP